MCFFLSRFTKGPLGARERKKKKKYFTKRPNGEMEILKKLYKLIMGPFLYVFFSKFHKTYIIDSNPFIKLYKAVNFSYTKICTTVWSRVKFISIIFVLFINNIKANEQFEISIYFFAKQNDRNL